MSERHHIISHINNYLYPVMEIRTMGETSGLSMSLQVRRLFLI
jgi:hypothetical protein